MALLAEALIDEWLNRQGYLTMRGIKHSGVDEIDLLGVRPCQSGLEACHVEVQISFRPIGYVSKLPAAYSKKAGKVRTSAIHRSPELLTQSVNEWVMHKFTGPKKMKMKERVWPNLVWQLKFVHAEVRSPEELEIIKQAGVEVIPFHKSLLTWQQIRALPEPPETDITEIVHHFARYSQGSLYGKEDVCRTR